MELSYLTAIISILNVKLGEQTGHILHLQQLGTTAEQLRQRLNEMVQQAQQDHDFDTTEDTTIHLRINKQTDLIQEENNKVNYQMEVLVQDKLAFSDYQENGFSKYFK